MEIGKPRGNVPYERRLWLNMKMECLVQSSGKLSQE